MRELILADITAKTGRLNEDLIYDITFVDPETLDVFMSVIDVTYKNYTRNHWDQIVRDPKPYGLYSGLRATAKRDKTGTQVITADSRPHKLMDLSQAEIIAVIEAIKQERKAGGAFDW